MAGKRKIEVFTENGRFIELADIPEDEEDFIISLAEYLDEKVVIEKRNSGTENSKKESEFKMLTDEEYDKFMKYADNSREYCPKKSGEFIYAPIVGWY